ncbi:MAG: methyltransferase domain-containing protein [Kangiellaceae bacterium]|jgi:SAM-dependent methyltransferase|nr:methyltransferase domain-containing protein [Kangiellaceae bacterium]
MLRLKVNKPDGYIPNRWQYIAGGLKASNNMQQLLDAQLPQIFGYYGLALGPLTQRMSFDQSPVGHWFNLTENPASKTDILGQYHQLPIASDSIDSVVISHLLEFIDKPHQLIREVERVMIPDGTLILSGINPMSLFGLRHITCRLTRNECQAKRLIGLSSICDWMTLIGYSVNLVGSLDRHHFVTVHNDSPTSTRVTWTKWLNTLSSRVSSHYFIIATKQVSTMTPIRPSWRINPKLVPARFAEPRTRNIVEKRLSQLQR